MEYKPIGTDKIIRVLIADDSEAMRCIIRTVLESEDGIRVVYEAENGKEAIEMNHKLKPDLVTMDIDMPVVDGLEAIEYIMAHDAVPILVVTGVQLPDIAFKALAKGALDVIYKSEIGPDKAREFIHRVKLLSMVKVIRHISKRCLLPAGKKALDIVDESICMEKIIAIASSTGGPRALSILLKEFPEYFQYPIVVAQHIVNDFLPNLVAWLDGLTRLKVKIAVENEEVIPGVVYFSPTEKHMEIDSNGKVVLFEKKVTDIYQPSCDKLLASVAKNYGKKSIGIILTGMGHDGALGIRKIKEAGGMTFAQDEESSVVFGMPKVAIDSGYVDEILTVEEMSNKLLRMMTKERM